MHNRTLTFLAFRPGLVGLRRFVSRLAMRLLTLFPPLAFFGRSLS